MVKDDKSDSDLSNLSCSSNGPVLSADEMFSQNEGPIGALTTMIALKLVIQMHKFPKDTNDNMTDLWLTLHMGHFCCVWRSSMVNDMYKKLFTFMNQMITAFHFGCNITMGHTKKYHRCNTCLQCQRPFQCILRAGCKK